jgi:hypothetical protein
MQNKNIQKTLTAIFETSFFLVLELFSLYHTPVIDSSIKEPLLGLSKIKHSFKNRLLSRAVARNVQLPSKCATAFF